MSWFARSVSDEDSLLVVDALDDVLAHLEGSTEEPVARLARLRERLARPPVPSGLRREVGAVLQQLAASKGDVSDDETPEVVAEMARAMVGALDAASLLDNDLYASVSELSERVPARVGRGDARRLTRDAEFIREVALPAKERARKLRQETQQLVTDIAAELTPGLRHATSLDWGIGELSDALGHAREPEAFARVRQELTGIARELAGNSAAVRARLGRAMEKVRVLEDALEDTKAKLARAQRESERDALTGLLDRGAFDRRLVDATRNGERASDQDELCLIVMDIDHFKRINDSYGHPVGDEVLRRVADVIREQVRADDVVGRLGGEEFGILLHSAPLQTAIEVVERIRSAIEGDEHGSGDGEDFRVTLSAGVATQNTDETALGLYKRADRALYEAKSQGRNRFILAA